GDDGVLAGLGGEDLRPVRGHRDALDGVSRDRFPDDRVGGRVHLGYLARARERDEGVVVGGRGGGGPGGGRGCRGAPVEWRNGARLGGARAAGACWWARAAAGRGRPPTARAWPR